MIDTAECGGLTEQTGRVFARPNAGGVFDPDVCEQIDAPSGLFARVYVIEQSDGWRASVEATLPEAEYSELVCPLIDIPYASRETAVIFASERLVAWCGSQKEQGKKKHQAAAARVQDWALGLAKRVALEAAGATREVSADEITTGTLYVSTTPEFSAPQMYALADLHPHPLNPRKLVNDETLEALAQDMRDNGFRPESPIYACPRPEGGAYALKGHRRRLAALRAGLSHVPVAIMQVSERRALEILNFDNDGGESIHFLHVADGWRNYIDQAGATVKEIASRAGTSIEAVYKRLKCLKLIEAGRALCLSGRISESHAALIAPLPEDMQADAVEYCTAPAWYPERDVPSVGALEEWIKTEKRHRDTQAEKQRQQEEQAVQAQPAEVVPVEVSNEAEEAESPEGESSEQESEAEDTASSVSVGSFADRMRAAPDANAGRELIAEHAKAVNALQVSMGMVPTVGQISQHHIVGFSVVSAREWRGVLARARVVDTSQAAELEALVKDGTEMHGEPWNLLLSREHVHDEPAVTPKPAPKRDTAAEDRQRAEEAQRESDRREEERKRVERDTEIADKTFMGTVDAILAKLTGDLSKDDLLDIFAVVLSAVGSDEELCEKFRVPRGAGSRYSDVMAASKKASVQTIVKMMFAALLLDSGANTLLLTSVARRYKVNQEKIRKSVEAEINAREHLRAAADPRKEAIAKLPALNAPKAAKAKPAAKKAPASKSAKKSATPAKKAKGKK